MHAGGRIFGCPACADLPYGFPQSLVRHAESALMDSVNLETSPLAIAPAARPPRVWKFWGTTLWGLFVFVAMFAGQMTVIVYLLLREGGSFDAVTATRIVGGGTSYPGLKRFHVLRHPHPQLRVRETAVERAHVLDDMRRFRCRRNRARHHRM